MSRVTSKEKPEASLLLWNPSLAGSSDVRKPQRTNSRCVRWLLSSWWCHTPELQDPTHTPINTSQCQVNKLISSKTAKKYSILILISIFTGWHFSANVSLDYNSQIFINCMIVLYEFQEMRNYWRTPKERGWLKMYLLLIEGEENHDTCDQIWVKKM